jgi:hypothetical protein
MGQMQIPLHEYLHGYQYMSFHLTTVCPSEAKHSGSAFDHGEEKTTMIVSAIPAVKIEYVQAALVFMMWAEL